MVLLELHNNNSLDWLHLNFIFLKRKFWSSNLLFNEKAFSARKKFSRALFTSCVTREVGGKLYFSTLSHK